MKDRDAVTYEEALAIQEEHLNKWKERLDPLLFEEVKAYVLRHNAPTESPETRHTVWRGYTLYILFINWPDVPAPYPPAKDASPADLI